MFVPEMTTTVDNSTTQQQTTQPRMYLEYFRCIFPRIHSTHTLLAENDVIYILFRSLPVCILLCNLVSGFDRFLQLSRHFWLHYLVLVLEINTTDSMTENTTTANTTQPTARTGMYFPIFETIIQYNTIQYNIKLVTRHM